MNPFRGRQGVPSPFSVKVSRRILVWASAGIGGTLLIPIITMVIVVAIAASPVSMVGNWIGGLFGNGAATSCATTTATVPSGPIQLPAAALADLDSDQQIFAVELARLSHLDVSVLAAWMLNEESGGAATSRSAQRNNDWLNIGYTDSATYGGTDAIWLTPTSAAKVTYEWLIGQPSIPGYGIASGGIQAIMKTGGQSAATQINAIRTSGWASSGEPLLPILYSQISGTPMTTTTVATVLNENPTPQATETVYQAYMSGGMCSTAGDATLTLSPGDRATILPNGTATAPRNAPAAVKAAINAANQLVNKPYIWGGGHTAPLSVMQPGYDCSGSTSFVLHAAGLLGDYAEVSGDLESWGAAGPGRWITIYANSGHVFMNIAGLAFNTAWYATVVPSTPSSGPRWQPYSTIAAQIAGDSSGFTPRHSVGL